MAKKHTQKEKDVEIEFNLLSSIFPYSNKLIFEILAGHSNQARMAKILAGRLNSLKDLGVEKERVEKIFFEMCSYFEGREKIDDSVKELFEMTKKHLESLDKGSGTTFFDNCINVTYRIKIEPYEPSHQ